MPAERLFFSSFHLLRSRLLRFFHSKSQRMLKTFFKGEKKASCFTLSHIVMQTAVVYSRKEKKHGYNKEQNAFPSLKTSPAAT